MTGSRDTGTSQKSNDRLNL